MALFKVPSEHLLIVIEGNSQNGQSLDANSPPSECEATITLSTYLWTVYLFLENADYYFFFKKKALLCFSSTFNIWFNSLSGHNSLVERFILSWTVLGSILVAAYPAWVFYGFSSITRGKWCDDTLNLDPLLSFPASFSLPCPGLSHRCIWTLKSHLNSTIAGGWSRSHNDELHRLYKSHGVIRIPNW